MRWAILFLLITGLSATAGAVPVADIVSTATTAANAGSNLLGLGAPPAYVPSIPTKVAVGPTICQLGTCGPSRQFRANPILCVSCCKTCPFVTCDSYIPCHGPFWASGFGVTDRNMLPGSRQFYETQRVNEFKATSAQLDYLLKQRSEQYYLLTGIKNAIGMPDAKMRALIEESRQIYPAPTDFGCLQCEKLADLAIAEKKITDAQRTQYMMQCAQKTIAEMIDLNKDQRDNTTFAAQKQCLEATYNSAIVNHAAYSMNAFSELRRVHDHMRQLFTEDLVKTLYEPCVEDLSVFQNQNPLAIIGALAGFSSQFIKDPLIGGGLSALGAAFSTKLQTLNMPISGCIIRSLAMIQKLEADRSLLEQYTVHLKNLKLQRDSLHALYHNPNYHVWQE